jgi:hypothetical protein
MNTRVRVIKYWFEDGVLLSKEIVESGYDEKPAEPERWVGLTDEECVEAIDSVFSLALDNADVSDESVIHYARAIEAKLKRKNT